MNDVEGRKGVIFDLEQQVEIRQPTSEYGYSPHEFVTRTQRGRGIGIRSLSGPRCTDFDGSRMDTGNARLSSKGFATTGQLTTICSSVLIARKYAEIMLG